jgi:hypothetical protein
VRLAFDSCRLHPGFELVGRQETAGLIEALPLEQQREVVEIAGSVKNAAAALAVLVTEFKG